MSSAHTWLIVGLGNPGPTYAGNRHNIGAMAVDALARQLGAGWRSHKAGAAVATGSLGKVPVILAKPNSFMNTSGGPVVGVARYFGIPLEQILAVHDELDLPYSAIRLKKGGGEGGHNGLRSMSSGLGSRDYLRLRLGIGRPPGRQDPAAFVLRDFSALERKTLGVLVEQGADAVSDLLNEGLAAAQNIWHASTPATT